MNLPELKEAFQSLLLSGWDFPMIFAVIVTSITIIVLATRLLTGTPLNGASAGGQTKTPPMLPYWIPFLGHLPRFLYSIEGTLAEAKYDKLLSSRTKT